MEEEELPNNGRIVDQQDTYATMNIETLEFTKEFTKEFIK